MAAELEEFVHLPQVRGQKVGERLLPGGLLRLGHIDATALLHGQSPQGGEDLHRLPHHGPAHFDFFGQVLLGGQPVTGLQPLPDDVLKDALGRDLVPGSVAAPRARRHRRGRGDPL